MKGIYVNTRLPEIPKVFSDTLMISEIAKHCFSIHKPEYFYKTDNLSICGWFIYAGKLNNALSLSEDIARHGIEAIKKIEFGVYSGLFTLNNETFFFQDKTGLNYHFIAKDNGKVFISPILKGISDSIDLTVSEPHQSILNKRGHLFGKHTQYNEVTCLPPGAIVSLKAGELLSQNQLGDMCKHKVEALDIIPSKIKSIVEHFPKEKRCLALSGGFDSRLILSQASMQAGYCYGPENSADRPIARQFKDSFVNFYEFEFDKTKATQSDAEILDCILESPKAYHDPQFVKAYSEASSLTQNSDFFFDGFLGDIYQRGTYLYFKGVIGELYRFFPSLYKLFPLDAKNLLRKRYANLSAYEFELIYIDFINETAELDLPDYNKVVIYDSFLARGRRLISNGALKLNGCFKEVVPVFMHPELHFTFSKQNYSDAASFKSIKKIWRNVGSEFKNRRFENGYTFKTPSFLMPKVALFYRLLIHYVPGFQNYGTKK